MSQISKKWLEAFEMWPMRRLKRISWTECMSNKRVMTLAGVRRELTQSIQKQKLGYFGHLMRHNSTQRDLLEGMVEGERGRGQPKTQWSKGVQGWLEMRFFKCK